MKKLSGSGVIGLLLAMLIIALLYIIMMPVLKDSVSGGLYSDTLDKKSVQQEVDKQIEQIQNMRKQTIQYSQNPE